MARTGRPPKSIKERFWEKVYIGYKDECWEWLANKNGQGYGVLWCNKKKGNVPAHRASWEMFFGEIPNDLLVLHRCDNPPCVNPSHLFLGTHKDNAQDMINKGRKRYLIGREHPQSGQKHWGNKLRPNEVREIRRLYKTDKISMHFLAKMFKVGYSTVNYIINKRN